MNNIKITLLLSFIFSGLYTHAQTLPGIIPYEWQVPDIQAQELNDIKWLPGNRVIAVGDDGTILMSPDSSLTWQINQMPTGSDLTSVEFTDSLTFYTGGSEDNGWAQIYKTIDGGATWNLVFDTINMTITDMHFVNDTIGFAVGRTGKIIKTTDGGITWNFLVTGTPANFASVYFLNPDTGFAGGENYGLFTTTNGGISWSEVIGYPANECYSLCFVNDTLGWAGGYNGKIYRTINGGLNWVQQYSNTSNEKVKRISFSSPTQGIAISNSYVFKTINGVNWNSTFIYSSFNLLSCVLSPHNHILLCGTAGGIRRAWNFGSTYQSLNQNFSIVSLRSIKFINNTTGWACGENGLVYHTTNAGNTWSVDTADFFNSLYDIAPISAVKAMAIDYDGNVHTITNSGNTINETNLASVWLTGVEFPSANNGFICGYDGTAFRTTNGGTSWVPMNVGVTDDFTDMHFLSNSLGYILSYYGGVYKTINGGVNWTSSYVPGIFGPFYTIHFTSADTGFVIDDGGTVFRTTDGGANWISFSTLCLDNSHELYFIDRQHGYAVGSGNYSTCDIAYTHDAGLTWNGYNLPYAYTLSGVFATDTSNIFVVGSYNTIIKTGASIITGQEGNTPSLKEHWTLYPNPAQNSFMLSTNNRLQQSGMVNIFDISGRIVYAEKLPEGTTSKQIILPEIHKGLYFVHVSDDIIKLMIQ